MGCPLKLYIIIENSGSIMRRSFRFVHIIEDYNVWGFELMEEEMKQMTALEKDERFADY